MYTYQIYVRIDQAGTIVHGFTSAFETPQDGDILLYNIGPRHFHFFWPEPLINERGQFRYKWTGSAIEERTQQELDDEWATRPPVPPTPQDRIATLETENAVIALDLIETQIALEQVQSEQAALLLALVEAEVI